MDDVEQALAVVQGLLFELSLVDEAVGQFADPLLIAVDQLHQGLMVIGQFFAVEQLEQLLHCCCLLAVALEEKLDLALQ